MELWQVIAKIAGDFAGIPRSRGGFCEDSKEQRGILRGFQRVAGDSRRFMEVPWGFQIIPEDSNGISDDSWR